VICTKKDPGLSSQQIRLTPIDRLVQHPTHGSSNHVRVHAAHECEHDCQDSFTLHRGCIHSP
jgi:hypothetical protein